MVSLSDHIWLKSSKAIFVRPAVIALLFLIAGIITYSWFPGFLLPEAALIVGFIALVVHFLPIPPIFRWIPVGILFLLIGAWRAHQTIPHYDNPLINNLQEQHLPITVNGTVARDPLEYPHGATVLLDHVTIEFENNQIPISGLFALKLDDSQTDLRFGDRIQVWGSIILPSEKHNPGGIDWASVYHRQGIVAMLTPHSTQDVIVVSSSNKSLILTKIAYPLRRQIIHQIEHWFPTRSQPMISALLVGEREQLDPDFMEATRRSGVAHLLVISGFHVGVIALLLMGVLSLLRLPFHLRIILALLGIILFTMVAESRPPVVRAAIMAIILGGSYLVQRRWDLWNTLAAAAFFILLIRPADLKDPGFQLSFAAVASIMFFYPSFHYFLMQYKWIHRLRRVPIVGRGLYNALLISVCAQIGTLPIIAAQFGRIPTLGIPTVILGAPLIVLIMPFSLIVIVLGALGIPQAQWLAITTDQLVILFQKLSTYASNISFSSLKIENLNYLLVIGLFLIAYMSWHFRLRWARWGFALSLILVLNAAVWSSNDSDLDAKMEVTFLDVGQGSSAIVRLADGRSLLIDGGPVNPEWDAGERIIIPCLEAYHIDTLDAIIATHDDNDHLGGLISVIDQVPIRKVYWSGVGEHSETLMHFLQVLERHNIRPTRIQAGQTLPGFENIPIWILHPDSTIFIDPINSNNASIVLQIRIDQIAFLFPGDIESPTERRLLRYDDLLKSSVLLVPHHGSAFSSSDEFLKTVDPQIAVISVGRGNPHGHPTSEVITRLQSLPCQIERTDLEGAIVLRTDGNRIWKYDDWR